jgi:hypothetical protein
MRLISLTVLLLSLLSFAFAQQARKTQEFGNVTCDDLRSRVDNFFGELNELKDAKG